MSRHLAALATARALLGRVEPLVGDLDRTLERWGRYRHLGPVEGYYARLGNEDHDLNSLAGPESVQVDSMIRRVSEDFPAWATTLPGAATAVASARFTGLLAALCSHPDGYVRQTATTAMAAVERASVTTVVLRCIDPVPAVRHVAATAVEAVLTGAPMRLSRADYAILASPRARRLVPLLAASAGEVQATDPDVRRRDRTGR